MDAYYRDVRKVARSGASLIITIPKDVIERFNIKKGDYVEVKITPRKELGVRYENE